MSGTHNITQLSTLFSCSKPNHRQPKVTTTHTEMDGLSTPYTKTRTNPLEKQGAWHYSSATPQVYRSKHQTTYHLKYTRDRNSA
jgi:hypothetical protein